MIALLIGGIVVLCVGLLAIVFGIPVKEFSFGNTMILAGSVVASAGLLLIGLHVVVRELKNIARRVDGRPAQPLSSHVLSSAPVMTPPARSLVVPPAATLQKESRGAERKDEMLFSRDEPIGHQPVDEFDDFPDDRFQQPPLPSTNAPSLSASWQDERPAPARLDSAERGRRDILFASKRRNSEAEANSPDDLPGRNGEQGFENSFENAWPQSDRPQREPQRRETETARERLQPPRRAEAASVTIVKSGVVDSMAYSLYSDGSIEAQTPEGMVRFGSIEELRSHLDQRQ